MLCILAFQFLLVMSLIYEDDDYELSTSKQNNDCNNSLQKLRQLLETTPLLHIEYDDDGHYSIHKIILRINDDYKFDSIESVTEKDNIEVKNNGVYFMCTPQMILNKVSYYQLLENYLFTEDDLQSVESIERIYDLLMVTKEQMIAWNEANVDIGMDDILDKTMFGILEDKRSLRTLNKKNLVAYCREHKIIIDAINYL